MSSPFQKTPPPNTSNKRKSQVDTPRRPPLATNRDYQSFDLNKRRDAVLKHIGDYVPEVPTLFLLGSVLPQILPAHVDQVESKLRQGRHLVKSGDDTLWAVFSKSPSGMSEREDVAFAPFDSIWKNTVRMGHKVLKKSPTLTFNQNPDRTPVSDRDDLARPDGQCALADEQTIQALADLEMSYSHYSSVVLWEFKKKSNVKDISDNIRKVVWSCHNTLLTDPRRRFVTGITIEDTQTRVWYFSRTYIMATERFDFVKDHKTLIHLILALAFATPEELGFDSTISLYAEILPDDSKVIQFKMQVDDKTYVTRSPLSDYSADAIRGRAMRVWEVNEEGVPDACRVIKDVWIHTDSLSEGAQLRQLYALLQDVPASSDGRKPTDYFLSVVADEFVKVSDGRDDDTHAVLMRNRELPANAGHFQLIPQLARENRQSRSTRLSQPSHPSRPSRPTPMRGSGTLTMRAQPTGVPLPSPGCIQFPLHTKYRPRKHYRIVFQGVGVTLYKVPSLSEVLRALADATAGLKILHDLNLVHRDVSPGNILVMDGTGKLSDLEYMKPLAEYEASADLEGIAVEPTEHKTGSKHFTAIEVQNSGYLFVPHFSPAGDVLVTPGNEVFSFNPLHDLESILWITLWILTHYTAGDTLQPEQLNLANKFFDGEETLRFDMMRSVNFSSSHFPSEFSHAVKALNDVRSALAMKYTLFETDLAVNHARGTSFSGKFDGIHQELINIHRKAAASSEAVFLCYDNEEANEDSDVEAEHRPKRFRTIADSNYAIGHGDGEEEQ